MPGFNRAMRMLEPLLNPAILIQTTTYRKCLPVDAIVDKGWE